MTTQTKLEAEFVFKLKLTGIFTFKNVTQEEEEA